MNPKGHICNAVHVGDRVRFHFGGGSMDQRPGWPEDQGVVTEIVRRYGKRHGSNDLIIFNSEAQGESRPADATYIVEILEIGKGPRWRWRNSVGLNAERQKAMSNICATEKKGEWFGDFQSLMMQVLFTQHHLVLQSRLDFEKAFDLWKKTRVGAKALPRQYNDSKFFQGCQLVKVKPFKRWVMQNINRFLETADNCDRYDDEDNDENQRMFYADLDSFSDEMERQQMERLEGKGDSSLDAAMHLGCDEDFPISIEMSDVEAEGSCCDEAIGENTANGITVTYIEEKGPRAKDICDHLNRWVDEIQSEKK